MRCDAGRWRRAGRILIEATMNTRHALVRHVEDLGIVAALRLTDADRLLLVIQAIAEGGIRAVEVSVAAERGIDLIKTAAARLPAACVLGAGGVLDADTAVEAIDKGAQFVASPVFRPAVIDACHARDVPCLAGVFTPTEILNAWDSGADMVSLAPASALSPTFLREIVWLVPQLKVIPTGDVTIANVDEWIGAGAAAVCVGESVLDPKAIAAGAYEVVRTNAERICAAVRGSRTTQR